MSSDASRTPADRPETGGGGPDSRRLRPGSAVTVGVIGAVSGLALLVPAVLSPARSWALISTIVLALVLLWLFVVRPNVVIHAEGVRIVNPLRVVELTWPVITEVRSRWSLELVAGRERHTAWGVPADPGRPRHGRGMLSVGANKVRGKGTVEAPARSKVEAQAVAAEIEERIAADRKRKDGRTPRIATRVWDPVSVGLLLAGLAFFVIGTFVV